MTNPKKQPPALYAIVISHYAVSALCFLAVALMLFFTISDLGGHYFHPRLLAITHMAALGWGTLIIFGAAYQLIPVVFEENLFSYRLPWLTMVTFIAGLILLVCSFWIFEPGLMMQCGALLQLAAISLFSVNVFLTAGKRKKAPAIYQEFITTSCIWLIATAVVGAMLVFNFRFPFLPKDHLQFLKLHAHMGIAGWFLLLIIGVSAKLIPMFLVSRQQKESLLKWSFYLINGGLLLFLADTYIYGINVKTFLVIGLVGTGIISYLAYVVYCFKSRIKKQIELPITNTIFSLLFLGAALITLPLIVYYQLKNNSISIQFSTIYGSLLFMGWITALILGQSFKTLPFIVWVKKYEHLSGKVKTPLPADLYRKDLLKLQTVAFALFSIAFFAGLIIKNTLLIYAGSAALILVALLYLGNLILLILHKTKNF